MASLTLTLDPAIPFVIEPGFSAHISTADCANGQPLLADTASSRQLWTDPEFGTLMLKPLQLQDDWLDHAGQLPFVARLSLDYIFNHTDVTNGQIWEANVGSINNPWVFHSPATPMSLGPSVPPTGLPAPYDIGTVFGASETSGLTTFTGPPGRPEPAGSDLVLPSVGHDLRMLASVAPGASGRYAANQAFFFRWFMPDPALTPHQCLYAFAFGQYLLLCRHSLLEVYRDVSPGGDRSQWALEWKGQLFSYGSDRESSFNADSLFGEQSAGNPPGGERSLLVLPFRRQYVMLISNAQRHIVIRANNAPVRQNNDPAKDWDITRSDVVDIWALTGVVGRVQVQELVFEPGPATVNFPPIVTEYTPAVTPDVTASVDNPGRGASISSTITTPPGYTFPRSAYSNDCPKPTNDTTGQSRTFGLSLTLTATSTQDASPQFYALDVVAKPTFDVNPSPSFPITDATPAGAHPASYSIIQSARVSFGVAPGEGGATAQVLDFGPVYSLPTYYHRSEMPVQLALSADPLHTGYTDSIEVRPLRLAGAPTELTIRSVDPWMLVAESFLRDQRDYTGVGHITTVDTIIRQCGINTGTTAARELAEYPPGWADTNASKWDTPLGLPVGASSDNLAGDSVLGWKPQIRESGANYLKRIADYFSGWLMGFRADGTFFYLPYDFFTQPVITFFAHHGGVASGITPAASAGLSVSVSAGSASVQGQSVTVGGGGITIAGLTDNSLNYLYLQTNGTGTANTTGTTPAGAIGIGTATTAGGIVTGVDTSVSSGRQLSTSPVYRSPVEDRTIPPSGNIVQVVSYYQVDQSPQKSGLFVDWAALKNPAAPNFMPRYKWEMIEVNGAFSCPQMNSMAHIAFQSARRRLLRTSFMADFVSPTVMKIGQVFTLEGYGNYRLREYRARYVKGNWDIADYLGEKVEKGYA